MASSQPKSRRDKYDRIMKNFEVGKLRNKAGEVVTSRREAQKMAEEEQKRSSA